VRVDAGGSASGLDKLAGDGVNKKLKRPARRESEGERLWVCRVFVEVGVYRAEEGKTCWMRAKGNGEKIEVGLWGEMERETGGKTAMAERARSFCSLVLFGRREGSTSFGRKAR
jgi:hypothetical protein